MPGTNCARFDGCSIAISWHTRFHNQLEPGVCPTADSSKFAGTGPRKKLSTILLVNEAGTLKATRVSARHDHNRNRDHEWCHSAQARKRLAVSWRGRSVTRVLQEGPARARPSSLSA